MIEGKNFDSRGSLIVGHDGRSTPWSGSTTRPSSAPATCTTSSATTRDQEDARSRRAGREEPGLVRLLARARTASRSRGGTASTSCRTARSRRCTSTWRSCRRRTARSTARASTLHAAADRGEGLQVEFGSSPPDEENHASHHRPGSWHCLLAPGASRSTTIAPGSRTYKAAVAELEKLVKHEVEDKRLPALSIALVDDQKVVWAPGSGSRTATKKIRPRPRRSIASGRCRSCSPTSR